MNFEKLKKILKKNYKKIIVVCLIMLLFSNKMYENFTTAQALDAVKLTEAKVNNMAVNVGDDFIDLKSGIKLSKGWKDGATATTSEISNDTDGFKKLMIVGNKSAGGVRKVGIWDHLDVHGSQIVTGSLSVGSQIVTGSLSVGGDIKGGRLCIGNTCIGEDNLKLLKKLPSNFKYKSSTTAAYRPNAHIHHV